MQYICDTNYVIRYLLQDNTEMFARANAIFEQAISGKVTLIFEQAVFTEIIFVLSSVYKVPKDIIVNTLSELVAYKGIKSDRETLLLALEYYKNHNIHIVDALLLARNKTANIPIITFDKKLHNLQNAVLS
jgi:predicted nucleic-acid-binding protein